MVDWSSLNTVFLDMDGTLLDLHFDNHFWLEHLPARYAEHYDLHPQEAKDRLIPMIMAERGSLNWYCTDYWSERLSLDITGLKAEVGDRIGYRPHVTDFLDALRQVGLHSVIVTNCHPDPLALKLKRTGLDTRVDAIVSSHRPSTPRARRYSRCWKVRWRPALPNVWPYWRRTASRKPGSSTRKYPVFITSMKFSPRFASGRPCHPADDRVIIGLQAHQVRRHDGINR